MPPFITQLSPTQATFCWGQWLLRGGMRALLLLGHGLRSTTSQALCPPEWPGCCARHWEQSEAWRLPLTPLLTACLSL